MTENKAKYFTLLFDQYKVALFDYNVRRWIKRKINNLKAEIIYVDGFHYEIKTQVRKRIRTVERHFLFTAQVNFAREHKTVEQLQWIKEDKECKERYEDFILQRQISEREMNNFLRNVNIEKLKKIMNNIE